MGLLPRVLEEAGRAALARAHVAPRVRRRRDVGAPGARDPGGVRPPARGGLAGIGMQVGPSILRLGTGEQKQAFLPGMAAGEIMWAEGYTEPNAGSDLASLRTRAVLDGDEWVIDGQKTFCTAGHHCNWFIIAARTDPDHEQRHKGISYFLSPMDAPGIELRPLQNIADGRQNVVFLDGVRVPANRMLGDLNQGWNQVWFGLGGNPIPRFDDDDPGPEEEYEPRSPATRGCSTSSCGTAAPPGVAEVSWPTTPWCDCSSPTSRSAWRSRRSSGTRACDYGFHLHQAITKEYQPEFAQTCMEILGPLAPGADRRVGAAGRRDRPHLPPIVRQPRRWDVAGEAHGRRDPRPRASEVGGVAVAIDLHLDADQLLVQHTAGELFRTRYPADVVREIEAGELGYSPEGWREMAGLGWLGITFPEEHGGTGGRFLDLYPIYEEMGRHLVPSPHLDTVAIAGESDPHRRIRRPTSGPSSRRSRTGRRS